MSIASRRRPLLVLLAILVAVGIGSNSISDVRLRHAVKSLASDPHLVSGVAIDEVKDMKALFRRARPGAVERALAAAKARGWKPVGGKRFTLGTTGTDGARLQPASYSGSRMTDPDYTFEAFGSEVDVYDYDTDDPMTVAGTVFIYNASTGQSVLYNVFMDMSSANGTGDHWLDQDDLIDYTSETGTWQFQTPQPSAIPTWTVPTRLSVHSEPRLIRAKAGRKFCSDNDNWEDCNFCCYINTGTQLAYEAGCVTAKYFDAPILHEAIEQGPGWAIKLESGWKDVKDLGSAAWGLLTGKSTGDGGSVKLSEMFKRMVDKVKEELNPIYSNVEQVETAVKGGIQDVIDRHLWASNPEDWDCSMGSVIDQVSLDSCGDPNDPNWGWQSITYDRDDQSCDDYSNFFLSPSPAPEPTPARPDGVGQKSPPMRKG